MPILQRYPDLSTLLATTLLRLASIKVLARWKLACFIICVLDQSSLYGASKQAYHITLHGLNPAQRGWSHGSKCPPIWRVIKLFPTPSLAFLELPGVEPRKQVNND